MVVELEVACGGKREKEEGENEVLRVVQTRGLVGG